MKQSRAEQSAGMWQGKAEAAVTAGFLGEDGHPIQSKHVSGVEVIVSL